jgi:hypothetical protein
VLSWVDRSEAEQLVARLRLENAELMRRLDEHRLLDSPARAGTRLVQTALALLELQRGGEGVGAALQEAIEVQVSVRLHRQTRAGGSASITTTCIGPDGLQRTLQVMEVASGGGHR